MRGLEGGATHSSQLHPLNKLLLKKPSGIKNNTEMRGLEGGATHSSQLHPLNNH